MDDQKIRARKLGLHGLAEYLEQNNAEPWPEALLHMEESARGQRSLDRRIRAARLGRFKSMADFDWTWPSQIDQPQIRELLGLHFIASGVNVVLAGPNGIGKSMIACNIGHAALTAGHSVLFTSTARLLNRLAAEDSASTLERHLRGCCRPTVLILDEVGYLSYGNRHADLLFEIVSRRYERGRPIVITTNRPFSEWNQTFPNASCLVTMIDRLCHRCEVVKLDGKSYRLKESLEQREERARGRAV
jgi:DNA replication protein DnaC